MSLRLILVRHAKSSWDDAALDDHARPLNDRGRRSATAIGKWLNEHEYTPARVLSSDAARTRKTWALIAAELAEPPAAEWVHRLYHAAPQDILDVLRGAGTASPVLMLGHNPGFGAAARGFAVEPPEHPKFAQYPTAATTVFDFDAADWSAVAWGGGTVRDFVVPRDLGVS